MLFDITCHNGDVVSEKERELLVAEIGRNLVVYTS